MANDPNHAFEPRAAAPLPASRRRGTRRPATLLLVSAAALLFSSATGRLLAQSPSREGAQATEVSDQERFNRINQGWQLYQRYCKSCHGEKAEGDGSVARFLTIPVADLTQITRRRGGEFPEEELRRILDGREEVRTHGRREMPVWGEVFDDTAEGETTLPRRLDALIEFLRSINPPAGDAG